MTFWGVFLVLDLIVNLLFVIFVLKRYRNIVKSGKKKIKEKKLKEKGCKDNERGIY